MSCIGAMTLVATFPDGRCLPIWGTSNWGIGGVSLSLAIVRSLYVSGHLVQVGQLEWRLT